MHWRSMWYPPIDSDKKSRAAFNPCFSGNENQPSDLFLSVLSRPFIPHIKVLTFLSMLLASHTQRRSPFSVTLADSFRVKK